MPTALIPPDLLAMMDRGVSVIASSCDALGRPSLMRAVGSAVSPTGDLVTVFVSRSQSRQLLLDVTASGRVAAVFSSPSSHHTVQVKSSQATTRAAHASDQPALARYLAAMERELQLIGINATATRAMLAHDLDDLVAITFGPSHAFDQTPGPKAGAALPVQPG